MAPRGQRNYGKGENVAIPQGIRKRTNNSKASTSRATPRIPELPPPEIEDTLEELSHQERYIMFYDKEIVSPQLLDLDAVKGWNLEESLGRLVRRPVWHYLLTEFQGLCYWDEICQALSSMRMHQNIKNTNKKVFSFEINEILYNLSLDDISRIMGFDALENRCALKKTLLKEDEKKAFVKKITNMTTFRAGKVSSSNFKCGELKLMNHILTKSICESNETSCKISKTALLCLYGMVENVPIHMGVVVTDLLRNQSNPRVKKIFMGPYLNKLIRSNPEVEIPERGKVEGEPIAATRDQLNKVYSPFIRGHEAAEAIDEEQEDEPVGDPTTEARSSQEVQPPHLSTRALLQELLRRDEDRKKNEEALLAEIRKLSEKVEGLEGEVRKLMTPVNPMDDS